MIEDYSQFCLSPQTQGGNPFLCLDVVLLLNVMFMLVFLLGVVSGICLLRIWQTHRSGKNGRTPVRSSSESGNVFFAIFASVAMVGVLGAATMNIMRGPVRAMSDVTRNTVAENNMIAGGRLAVMMSPVTQPADGDCDADTYVEPIPFRDAAGLGPAGGGFLPTNIGASLTDPWQREYGYCVWDHGPLTVADNIAGCGGTAAHRLDGASQMTQIAVAVISAGKDRTFQTSCNAFIDANVDGVPDTPLVVKPGTSDDLVFTHTYGEAMAMGGALWQLKTGDPTTATIGKDIEVAGDARFSGIMRFATGAGFVLPGDPGNNSITGGCNAANDQALRRNTSNDPPSLEICDFAGGATDWEEINGSGGAGDDLGNHVAEQILDMGGFRIENAAAPTAGNHLATKSYVDFAVASASGGAGSGVFCYYTTGTCGTTFQQMGGTFRNDAVSHKICCSAVGSAGDAMPNAFDFPDSPVLAPNAAHTWTAIQITGFDPATVSVSGHPDLQYRICSDSACTNVLKNWKTTSDIITDGLYLQLRVLSTSTGHATANVQVGDYIDTVLVNKPWYAFVTTGTWTGNLGGLSGADLKCQTEASAAGLPGTFRAWLATSASDAPGVRFENTGTVGAIYRRNGTKLVDSWADLIDGSLDNALSFNASGGSESGGAWTNVSTSGGHISTSNDCGNWTSSNAFDDGNYGSSTAVNNTWTNNSNGACSSVARLYCFQTVPH